MSAIPKPSENEKVKVVVRCRPMNQKEQAKGCKSIIRFYHNVEALEILYEPKCGRKTEHKYFEFDAVYACKSTQEELYNDMVRPLVTNVLEGFNATIFAYGQTGTGKTYTMEGDNTCEIDKGIIPRVFDQIFGEISRSQHAQFMLRASYMEIYQDEIRDLLVKNSSHKLEIRENHDGAFVDHLSNIVVDSHQKMVQMFEFGKTNRTTRTTDMNDKSSRSHAIFTIFVEMSGIKGSILENTNWIGSLNLVDLAGSERQNKTNSEGTRLKEASKINLSLTALGNVISALQERGNHVPYRDSKLTRLLKDSLGGNSKTLMIANIGPACYNHEETLNTLRFASRSRNIKNEPRVNEDPVDTMLKSYQEQILTLKTQIAQRDAIRKEKLKEAAKSGKEEKIVPYISPFANEFVIKIINDNEETCFSGETPEKKLDSMKVQLSLKSNESLPESEAENKYIWELTQAIEAMESRMLRGSTNIQERTSKQQRALELHANEIRLRKQKEQEMKEMLEMQEETADEIKEGFSNLQQEVEAKTHRLDNVYCKLLHIQYDIRDVAEEFNTDRRELEMTQNELLRELKLALKIIDNFIPSEEKRRILSRLFYDEELDNWKIMPESEPAQDLGRPHCSRYMRNPQPTHSASQMEVAQPYCVNGSSNLVKENHLTVFRDKREDIIDLDLVSPLRTTRDYESPKMSPVLKSIFDAALKGEEDIDVDAASVSSRNSSTSSKSGSNLAIPRLVYKVLTSASSKVPPSSAPVYPKARGWVPK